MKKTFTFFAAILIIASVFAQAPQKMSYQSVIRDGSNNLVTSHAVGMKISILQSSGTGTEVYKEIYNPNPQTNANGLVTIEIGSGIPLTGVFSNIDWANGPYFIKTETDPTGGTNYTITGTSQLLSVPYALHAKTAESITGTINETDPIFVASPANGITNTNITNWNASYGWGNHATAGYLTSFTETDPLFVVSPANGITGTNITNWATAYGWGNHATAGYLTSFTETDPVFGTSIASGITAIDTSNWNNKLENEVQNIQNVLTIGNDAGNNSIVNVSQLTIGSASHTQSTALEVSSTNGAFLLPRMSTAQRNLLSASEGMMIYNTDLKKFQGYTNNANLIDQNQLTIDNAGGGNRAQSFTAGMSGNLSSIELPFNTMSGSFDVNIIIRDGAGTSGSILHSQTFTIPGGGMIWYPFNISGVNVVAGNQYTIQVTEVAFCGMPPCYDWGMTTSGDLYLGGMFYFNGTPYSGGVYDCAFKTYIGSNSWVDLH